IAVSSSSAPDGIVSEYTVPSAPVTVRVPPQGGTVLVAARAASTATTTPAAAIVVVVVLLVGVVVVVVPHSTSANRCRHLSTRRRSRSQRPGFEVAAVHWRVKRLQVRWHARRLAASDSGAARASARIAMTRAR